MLTLAFRRYGAICASHSWEVILATLAAIFLAASSLSMYAAETDGFLCKFRYLLPSSAPTDRDISMDERIDVIFVYLTRCAALIYLFYQFQSLRKMGSRYIMGVTAFFILLSFSGFIATVTSFLGLPLASLSHALPFFLLLMDLHKAASLAQMTLSSETKEELVENVSEGMYLIGPSVLLDALVEIMVFSSGFVSSYGLNSVKSICCLGFMSAIANVVVFLGIFPPFLSLIAGVSISHAEKVNEAAISEKESVIPTAKRRGFAYQLSRLSFTSTSDDEEFRHEKTNPVLQGIKVVMVLSLLAIHAYSHLIDDSTLTPSPDRATLPVPPSLAALVVAVSDSVHLSPEQTVSLVVGALLVIRFLLDGEDDVQGLFSATKTSEASISSLVSLASSASDADARASFIVGDFEPCSVDVGTQTDFSTELVTASTVDETRSEINFSVIEVSNQSDGPVSRAPLPVEDCLNILRDKTLGPNKLTDDEVLTLVEKRLLPAYSLEKTLGDPVRGVKIRRCHLARKLSNDTKLNGLPYENFDYSQVMGVCCENIIGHVGLPVGVVGPLRINGLDFHVPLATLEGALVASTNRGCKALTASGGVLVEVLDHGMTRGPLVAFNSVVGAKKAMDWIQMESNFASLKETFSSTTRFGSLESVVPKIVGKLMFIRFKATTGDAMGMNMVSKGTERCLERLAEEFPDMRILSVSGNFCVDKKPNALNWIEGRGWSVSCEAVLPRRVVADVLKTTPAAMARLNVGKNLVGSAVAGSLGGFNAHAANIVTALFLATGQDAAQSGTSSSCVTVMELASEDDEDELYVSVTMPSIEVGTVGGGTSLTPQSACLDLLGVKPPPGEYSVPGSNARRLAEVVAATVLAGELSLMAALAEGHLVKSHLRLNRSASDLRKVAETN